MPSSESVVCYESAAFPGIHPDYSLCPLMPHAMCFTSTVVISFTRHGPCLAGFTGVSMLLTRPWPHY